MENGIVNSEDVVGGVRGHVSKPSHQNLSRNPTIRLEKTHKTSPGQRRTPSNSHCDWQTSDEKSLKALMELRSPSIIVPLGSLRELPRTQYIFPVTTSIEVANPLLSSCMGEIESLVEALAQTT